MRIRKRERVALLIFGLALVALAVDKLILPPPAEAVAEPAAPAVKQPRIPGGGSLSATNAPATQPAEEKFITPPDVFAWSRITTVRAPLAAPSAPAEIDPFALRHALKATMLSENSVALIATDQAAAQYRIGDRLDGMVLESIASDSVVFKDYAHRVVLTIHKAGGDAR